MWSSSRFVSFHPRLSQKLPVSEEAIRTELMIIINIATDEGFLYYHNVGHENVIEQRYEFSFLLKITLSV